MWVVKSGGAKAPLAPPVPTPMQMANCPNCPIYFEEPQAPLVALSLNLVCYFGKTSAFMEN